MDTTNLPFCLKLKYPGLLEANREVIFISAGLNNTFFLSREGQLYGCGYIGDGCLIMDPENEEVIIKKKK